MEDNVMQKMAKRRIEKKDTDKLIMKHEIQIKKNITDFESRFGGIDLDYYKQRIPPEQFELMIEIVGIYTASPGFRPEEDIYPEE
jgi:hypothetical protein